MYLQGLCCDDCERDGGGLAGVGLVVPHDLGGGAGVDTDFKFDAMNLIENAAGLIPVVGPFVQGAMQFADQLQTTLHVGFGRKEADVIVNDSNSGANLLLSRLNIITDAMLISSNPTIEQLQDMFLAVYTMGELYKRFVLSSQFTDRRASGQALNTMMPYIDGTCGYSEPLGQKAYPSINNCGLRWGDNTAGGPGTDGMMGALSRAIISLGGRVPAPQITQGAGSSIATLAVPSIGMQPQAGWIPPNRSPLVRTPVKAASSNMGLLLLGLPLLGLLGRGR